MVLPLIPYSRTRRPLDANGRAISYLALSGSRQRAPYTIDTDYYRLYCWRESRDSGDWDADTWAWNGPSVFPGVPTTAKNDAYKKMVAKLGNASFFGATLTAERNDTWQTVVGTITRCLRAARCAYRLDPRGVARELGLPYRERVIKTVRYTRRKDGSRKRAVVSRKRVFSLPTGREVLKTLGNTWLLYSYGIKPLMQDIYNGMDVLQRPFPASKVVGRGKSSDGDTYTGDGGLIRMVRGYSADVRCSCHVRVENPNLWLCNRMGLINPVQWLLEAIPMSFVADWFSNLSDVVNSMTDFVGLEVLRPCTTYLYIESNFYIQSFPPSWGYESRIQDNRRSRFWRKLEIPTVDLHFAYERFNWQRGLNAISLLLGFLPRK